MKVGRASRLLDFFRSDSAPSTRVSSNSDRAGQWPVLTLLVLGRFREQAAEQNGDRVFFGTLALPMNLRRAARFWTAVTESSESPLWLWQCARNRSSPRTLPSRAKAATPKTPSPQSKTLARGLGWHSVHSPNARPKLEVKAPRELPNEFKAFTVWLVLISERFESFGNSCGRLHGFKARSWTSRNSHSGLLPWQSVTRSRVREMRFLF